VGAFAGILVVLVLLSITSYRGYNFTDSVQFCGEVCHGVMKPEYTAYQNSPHARVACVNCHIGPGANWFVKSKLSGTWQVIAVTFNLYERPIPTPVKALRPARETCEVCHWPQKFAGNRVHIIDKFTDDERTKHLKTVLLLKIGGGGGYEGIHGAHMGPGVEVTYGHSDVKRQTIPWVQYSRNGDKTVFKADGFKDADFGKLQMRPVAEDGTPGDWTPLGTLVRTPQITTIHCTSADALTCTIDGSPNADNASITGRNAACRAFRRTSTRSAEPLGQSGIGPGSGENTSP